MSSMGSFGKIITKSFKYGSARFHPIIYGAVCTDIVSIFDLIYLNKSRKVFIMASNNC